MSEIAKAYLRQTGIDEQRPERTLHEVVAVEGRPHIRGEHKPAISVAVALSPLAGVSLEGVVRPGAREQGRGVSDMRRRVAWLAWSLWKLTVTLKVLTIVYRALCYSSKW
jgi:hypothetical protein